MSTTNSAQIPAYVSLATKISQELRAMGIELVAQRETLDGFQGNKGWVCWQHAGTQQKIYLSRTKAGQGIIHTSLRVDPSTPGYIDPKGKAPGKIESFFKADAELVAAHLLPLFAGTKDALRATRRAASSPASLPAPQSPTRDMSQEI